MSTKTSLIKKCLPCEGGLKPLSRVELKNKLVSLKNWKVTSDSKVIQADWIMKNFVAAVKLINQIAQIAESENHHPDIHLTGYRNLTVSLTTHAIKGLSENDFILAEKINQLPKDLKL